MAEMEAARLGSLGNSGIGDDEATAGMSRWERLWQGYFIDLFVDPRPSAVKRVVDRWWSRYGLLVFLPAALVCCYMETLGIRRWVGFFAVALKLTHLCNSGRCVVRSSFPAVLVPGRG